MSQDAFFSRRTFGVSNWLLVAMAAAVVLAFVPRGARFAIKSNNNKAEDWLPASYPESTALRWFRDHFMSEQFVLVSWDGCTLGDTERLELLAAKLRKAPGGVGPDAQDRWFTRVTTGPEMIDSLTQEPSSLDRGTAVRRLEGALIGPPARDAEGQSLGEESRTTCLIAYLTPEVTSDNKSMRAAVDLVEKIAATECGIPVANVHMGGPPVDNVTIDKEGERTLLRLAGLSGLVGFGLSYWCFRSLKMTSVVFAVGVISAGVSLAIVFYWGIGEVLLHGRTRYGTVDAILMSMPAVVYVLGLSGATHLVNYYRDERSESGVVGAVERAVKSGWKPCFLAALTTSVGLGSLAASDIVPIKKFGMFTAIGVLATLGVLFTVLPLILHAYPPKADPERERQRRQTSLPPWAVRFTDGILKRNLMVTAGCLVVMMVLAVGLARIHTSVKLLELLDPSSDLIGDYAWLEQHLGNLVPMEVVVALPPSALRGPRDSAEGAEGGYRMTMQERITLVRRLQSEIESLDHVSRALSAATFAPDMEELSITGFSRGAEYAVNKALAESRDALSEYLKIESPDGAPSDSHRELWRISARVAALADIDYGEFDTRLHNQVEPILSTYRTRDQLIERLHAEDKRLTGGSVCVLFAGAEGAAEPPPRSPAGRLIELLSESDGSQDAVMRGFNVSALNEASADQRRALGERLGRFDAVVALDTAALDALRTAGVDAPVLQLTDAPEDEAHISAVYTGVVPLVYKTQRELLTSLRESILAATVLIGGVMVVVLRSVLAGFVAMLPNIFPVVLIFGGLGWMGINVDIGIMMAASVALGVAVDDTIHFVTWFRRGICEGLDRVSATRLAYERCGVAMVQTTLIAGLGLCVFAASTFTPTQQFGYLMISILMAALIGDLIMLPSILAGPLGKPFAPGVPAHWPIETPADDRPVRQADAARATPPPNGAAAPEEPAAPEALQAPRASEIQPPHHLRHGQARPPVLNAASHSSEELTPASAALKAKLRGFRRTQADGPGDGAPQ